MRTRATARFIRVPASKARLVLAHIRGKSVGEALATLRFTPKAAARLIEKVLRSAIANAEHNHQVRSLDDLRVVKAVADMLQVLKRDWCTTAIGDRKVLGHMLHFEERHVCSVCASGRPPSVFHRPPMKASGGPGIWHLGGCGPRRMGPAPPEGDGGWRTATQSAKATERDKRPRP